MVLYPGFTVAWAALGGDLLILQKVVSRWLMPGGLIFLLAMLIAAVAAVRGQRLIALLGGTIAAIMLLATDVPTRTIARAIEGRYAEWLPTADEPFDSVVVLGGGTGLTPGMRPQLGDGGERLGLAARLYEQGLVKRIVVTGDALNEKPEYADSPREQGVELLAGFGVPSEDVVTLTGRTTTEEIASLKERPDLWEGKRCGLITSAMHLPRAMRLADRAGLEVIPIPANFRYPNDDFTPLSLIPEAGNLDILSAVGHEALGMLVGR